jgi:signal transduction histidine kinase
MDQVVEALTPSGVRSASIEESAGAHGAHLLRAGFSYSQVVHDYGNVCQAITGLADVMNAPITPDEFRTLNRCLDEAIAAAITEYSRLRDEAIDCEETEQVGALVRELRKPLTAAVLAYTVLKTGTVGLGGTTGAELGRSLRRVSALIDRTMAQARLDAGTLSRGRVSMFALMEDLEIGAALEAEARGLSLKVAPVEPDIDVVVDRRLLRAVVSNLIQNALQFTRPGGQVVVQVSCTDGRVRIEVNDECGGLPPGLEALLGPGLAFIRRSVEAIGAELQVRDIGAGCVFILDLPRQYETGTGAGSEPPG